jgi:hypothetical protein
MNGRFGQFANNSERSLERMFYHFKREGQQTPANTHRRDTGRPSEFCAGSGHMSAAMNRLTGSAGGVTDGVDHDTTACAGGAATDSKKRQ